MPVRLHTGAVTHGGLWLSVAEATAQEAALAPPTAAETTVAAAEVKLVEAPTVEAPQNRQGKRCDNG